MPDLSPQRLKKIVTSNYFERFILFVILLAGVVVGLQTYPDISAKYHNLFIFLDTLIVAIFVIEALLKIASEIPRPINYFKNSWNVFDFTIAVGCLLPLENAFLPAIRLLRVLRTFRIATTIPKMRLIVGAMLKSIPSMIHVFILFGVVIYIYAVMATFLFAENDPIHFGNLQTSLLTLIRVVTFDNWADVMYVNMYGCDQYGYEGALSKECTNPKAAPLLAAVFFTSFIMIAGLILLNFVIGVVINSMDEMRSEMADEHPGYDDLADRKRQEIILSRLDKIEEKLELISKKM